MGASAELQPNRYNMCLNITNLDIMKRVSILLIVAILTITSCEVNDISPTIDNLRLTRILNYSSTTSSNPYGTVEFEYDNQGNLIKESMFDHPNTLTTYKVYEYDGKRMIKKRVYDGQVGNLTLGTYISYSYTNNKLTKQELFLSNGTLKYTTYYEFDGDRLINTYKVDDNLGIHHQSKYTFDNLNRLILEEIFMYNQELSEYTKYYYDNSNRIVKSEFYNGNGTITSYVEKIYDGSSKLPNEELYFDRNGTQTQKRQLLYDSWGNLTEIIVNSQGTTCRLFRRKYKGELLTEEIKYHPNFGCTEWTVTRYEYQTY